MERGAATDTTLEGRHRYLTLDGYRFLAAAAIVTFHFGFDFNLDLQGLSRAFAKLHVYVDFFFVLSGFVIAESYASRVGSIRACASFLWRRLARIYPLHLATLAFLVASVEGLAWTGMLGERHAIFDPSVLPQNVMLVHAWGTTADQSWNLPSWSISAEWAAYLCFPLLVLAVSRLPVLASACLAVVLAASLHALRQRLGLNHWTDATSDGAMRALPTFLAGIVVSRLLAHAKVLPRVPWPAVHALFLLPLLMMHLGVAEDLAVALFPMVVLMAALAERAHGPGLAGKGAWVALGQSSYALYLIHFPIAFLAVHLVPPGAIPGGVPARFAYACAVALTCVRLSVAIHARFEVPVQRWLVRLPTRVETIEKQGEESSPSRR